MTNPNLAPKQHLRQIGEALDNLQRQHHALLVQIARLEKIGITNAAPYWRPDRVGNRTLLYLIHPSQHGRRQRDYIGKDLKKQKAALAAIGRFKQHAQLTHKAHRLQSRIAEIERAITDLHAEAIRT